MLTEWMMIVMITFGTPEIMELRQAEPYSATEAVCEGNAAETKAVLEEVYHNVDLLGLSHSCVPIRTYFL